MQIDRRGKRLVIRWKFEGKPYSLSFAGCNTTIGLLMVEGVANRIKLDIASGNFDRTKLNPHFSQIVKPRSPETTPSKPYSDKNPRKCKDNIRLD